MDAFVLIFLLQLTALLIFMSCQATNLMESLSTFYRSATTVPRALMKSVGARVAQSLNNCSLSFKSSKNKMADLNESDFELRPKPLLLRSLKRFFDQKDKNDTTRADGDTSCFMGSSLYKNFINAVRNVFSFRFLNICLLPLDSAKAKTYSKEADDAPQTVTQGTVCLEDRTPKFLKVLFNRKSERLIKLKLYKLSVKIAKDRSTGCLPVINEEDASFDLN